MSSEPTQPPKLSLVAELDDMFRFHNSFIAEDDEKELIAFVNNYSENRVKWLSVNRELDSKNKLIEKLENENKTLQSRLTSIRYAFAKEVQKREPLMKDRNALKQHLNAIKEFVLKDPITNQSEETKERLLHFLSHNNLETVVEVPSEESLSGLEFDASEEDILDESMATIKPLNVSKRETTDGQQNDQLFNNSVQSVATIDDISSRHAFDVRNRSHSEPIPEKLTKSETNTRKAIKSDSGAIVEGLEKPPFIPFSSSSPDIKPKLETMRRISRNMNPNLLQKFRTIDLDKREHTFQKKKVFKPTYCGSCGKSIGFCADCMVCRECRSICHINCKNQLALPCIPFHKPNGKSSRLLLIADYVTPNTLPVIPALIIHCCREVENRGLQEEGLYRKCASDKEVQELKRKILNSKTGIPVLTTIDVHIICGVIKQFLRDLDEPIVTRILWRDFVRAADQENADEEQTLIMQTVADLPMANRDSLAFLMLHLQRISRSSATLMNSSSLAKVFGPTIVGNSAVDLPMTQLLAESAKQIKVMEALFRIGDDFWNSIISTSDSFKQLSKPEGSPDRRTSLGTRLFGTVVESGSLTPQRRDSTQIKSIYLKPLF